MKKELGTICIFLFFCLCLLLVSCVPLSSEELQSRTAAQLQNLTDEELNQLANETSRLEHSKGAIAGQGIRLPRNSNINLRNAAMALQAVNQNSRTTIIQQERERRSLGTIQAVGSGSSSTGRRQDEGCSVDADCAGLRCRYDSLTQRHTCQWNIGDSCFNSSFNCASGLVCGFNGNIVREAMCLPDLCGYEFVCELVDQPRGAPCIEARECASRHCVVTDSSYSRQYPFGECA